MKKGTNRVCKGAPRINTIKGGLGERAREAVGNPDQREISSPGENIPKGRGFSNRQSGR